jgi:hypothetical protein
MHRNHVLLLMNNFGLGSPMLRRFAVSTIRETLGQSERRRSRRAVRVVVAIGGMLRGLLVALGRGQWRALDPTNATPGIRRA